MDQGHHSRWLCILELVVLLHQLSTTVQFPKVGGEQRLATPHTACCLYLSVYGVKWSLYVVGA